MKNKNKNPLTLILIGPSGSGKGTQARLLIDNFGFEYIEMGKILREEAKKDTDFGRKVNQIMLGEGKLLPDEMTHEIIKIKIKSVDINKKLIIDGYPRTLKQVKDLDGILKNIGRSNILAINIDVPEKVSIERLNNRLVCNSCKNNFKQTKGGYQEGDNCPKCQSGKLIKRADDTPKKIKERLSWAQEKVRPVIEEYKKRGVLEDIDGDQQKDKVYSDIIKNVKKCL